MSTMTLEQKEALIRKNQGKIFSVKFKKKDGTIRDMTARLGVTSHLRGGTDSTEHLDYLVNVFDMKIQQYRKINLNNLIEMKSEGETYVF